MAGEQIKTAAAFWMAVLLSLGVGMGGYLVIAAEQEALGWTVFGLVPFLAGFVAAFLVKNPRHVTPALITVGVVTFVVLLALTWEGIFCSLMALPIVAIAAGIGAAIGYRMRRSALSNVGNSSVILLLLDCLPMLMGASHWVEQRVREGVWHKQTIRTVVQVAASTADTWNAIQSFETLDGDQPMLMRVGLPVPNRCTLSHPGIGGKRICYFDGDEGEIRQEVTRWEPAKVVEYTVEETIMKGRSWLRFGKAAYHLRPNGKGGTELTRTTEIESRLAPRFYWSRLEAAGVKAEHEYVLDNAKRKAEQASIQSTIPATLGAH